MRYNKPTIQWCRESGGPSGPLSKPNYLFTSKNCFFWYALSARPYRWPIKRFRDIIHVGLNTLSRVYQNMKQQLITTAKVIPVVLIMWVITFIIQSI